MPTGYCTTNPTYLHLWLFSWHIIALPLSCPPVLSSLVVNNGGHPGGKEGKNLKQYACKLKIVTGLSWERFQILIFCVVVSTLLPFPSALTSLCTPVNRQQPRDQNLHILLGHQLWNKLVAVRRWYLPSGSDTYLAYTTAYSSQAVSQLKNCCKGPAGLISCWLVRLLAHGNNLFLVMHCGINCIYMYEFCI